MDRARTAVWVATALCALAVVASRAPSAAATPSASGAATAAASLAGGPVPVQCVTVAAFNAAAQEAPGQLWAYGIAGLYDSRTQTIFLTNATCADLATIASAGSGEVTLGQSLAAFTLAHEIGHHLLGSDEATADRYGLAHASAVAYSLGLRGRLNYVLLADWIRQYAPLHDGVQS